MKPELLTELLDRAMIEPLGLVIETNNPGSFKTEVSNHAKTDERYRALMVCVPSIDGHVFLVKKSVELDP